MSKFLYKVAEELNTKHQGDFRDVVIVLPARRSVLFLQKHLSQIVSKTFWVPQTFILPQFVEWISSRSIVSGPQALTDLYECYRQSISNAASFDVFNLWASTALKDFGDIDGSLSNSKQVFSNLQSIREIDSWSFNSESLTKSQLQFIAFWEELGRLYEAYNIYQRQTERWSYNALIKWIGEEQGLLEENTKGRHIYFIGMASFSIAEMKLIEKLNSITRTEVLWDADEYYVNDPMHEAGFFARKYREHFGQLNGISKELKTTKKYFEVYETTTSIGQCYGVAEKLKELSPEELENTCVVVADEKLAEPLLSALTIHDVPVNLAIGMPLGATTSAKWLATTLKIKQKLLTETRGIYHKDFVEWLQLSQSVGLSTIDISGLKNNIISSLWIYVTEQQLAEYTASNEHLQSLVKLLFEDDLSTFLASAKTLIRHSASADDISVLEKASARKMMRLIDDVYDMMERYDFLRNISSLNVLWNQMLSGEKLQYEGEPVNGLQVLGFRETRALDFDTVFILGANEETLPGSAIQQSFIPFELRGYYKLPMPNEQENMIAYMFYRLLQYPSQVHLFYSTISSDFKGTEQSRYITQLENELVKANSQITIDRIKMKMSEPEALNAQQTVRANAFVHAKLDKLFSRGISPSAINKFNTCPLDFYYRYILGLGEEEKLEEQMSSATFGSIVHHVLEKFYEAFKESYPKENDYEELKATLDTHLDEAFDTLYSTHNTTFGYNYLASKVATDMLVRIISFEKNLLLERNKEGIQPKLIDIEMTLSKSIPVENYDWNKPVALRGKVDRIEELAGITHILDYKTGKVEGKDVKLDKTMDELLSSDKHIKLVQLLCYIYMYSQDGKAPENVTAGFYSFVAHRKGFMMLEEKMSDEKLNDFERSFMYWVKRVYATEVFEHNSNSKFCEYCR